jgi:hypothetical protein
MSHPALKSARWILALTVVILLSYWKIVFTKQFSILWQWEIVNTHYAWYTFAARWIQHGIVPLWDPTRYGGNTFIGEMQNGLFYPFKLVLYLAPLDQNGLLTERAFNLFFVFSHWLAALWMFLLARYFKLDYFPALVAGICFGLGGFIQWTPWPYLLDAMVWLPLVVLFVLRAFDSVKSSSRIANAGIAGLALGMTVLAGSIHIAMIDGIVVATLTLYVWLSKRERQSILSAATILAVTAITSILFAAVQLLPSLEYSRLAYRWVGADNPIRPFERIPYSALAETAFGPQSLFAFVLGEADAGKSDMTTYFGVLPLILMIIGLWKYWSNSLVRYLGALAALAWVYTWSSSSLLHGVLYLSPLLDIAREADRFIYATNFAMAILAGFGVQFLFADRKPNEFLSLSRLLSILKWVVIGFAALLVAASLHFPISVTEKTYLSFFFLASSYGLILFLTRVRRTAVAQFIVVFLIAWDLYSFDWVIEAKTGKQRTFPEALSELRYDGKLAAFIKAQPGMPRVHFDMEGSHNIGNTYGVPVTWAMSATLLADYTNGIGYDRQRELLGVRYIVRLKGGKHMAKSTGPAVYSDDLWEVYEDPEAMPRSWIVHEVEVDSSNQRPAKQVIDPSFDLKRIAVVEQPLDMPLERVSSESAEAVRWLADEPNRVELEVATEGAGLVVLGEVFYPGWKAFVDGSPAKLYRADGLVRAVAVPRGTHRVSVRYEPASVRWGAILSVVTLLSVCGAAAFASGISHKKAQK